MMISLEELRAVRSKRRLTNAEKLAYGQYWEESRQSQRTFCEQERLSISTFSSWLKLRPSCRRATEAHNSGFISVKLSSKQVEKKNLAMVLQFTLPNGLVIEGHFLLNEVGSFIKELSDGLTTLR
jgi:hypothetical protein